MDRWGMFPFRARPRQADVLIVAGTLTTKMAGPLVRLWEQMPEPKWCVAMGDCTCSGGRYKRSYSTVAGIDRVLPVDVYLPGCPPRPEMLVHAIMMLQDKIMNESVKDRRDTFEKESRVSKVPGTLPVTEGTALERETEIEVAQDLTSRPYTVPSRHERRRSS